MLESQNGVCAVCGNTQKPYLNGMGRLLKHLVIDHDHQNGKIRGLLCSQCNQLVGKLEKNPALVSKAQEYIERCKQRRMD